MARKTAYKYEHEGWTITLDEQNKRWFTKDPESTDEYTGWYDTAREAEAAVEARNKNKAKAKRTPLNIEVLNEKGEVCIVHSIHAGKGELLSKGTLGYSVYPNVDWLRSLLQEAASLEKRAKEMRERSRGLEVTTRNYSFNADYAGSWEEAVEKLKESVEKQKQRAIDEESKRTNNVVKLKA